MARSRTLGLLLLLAPGIQAEEEAIPLVFFREPDKAARREILHEVSDKRLGSGARHERRASRARLRRIGPWAVPFLSDALTKRTKSQRVRMNAAMTLARIGDPDGVAALRVGARHDEHRYVRRTCSLALGLLGDDAPRPGRADAFREAAIQTLIEILRSRERGATKAAAALALAKTGHPQAAAELRAAAKTLSKDPHDAAAILIAATIVHDKTDLTPWVGHPEKLVRRAATTGLLIRPLPPTRADLLLERLKRERDPGIRALLYHALGAVQDGALRAALLRAATRSAEKAEARIAAAIELAQEYGVQESCRPLLEALHKIHSRNDPVTAPLIFALAMTGAPEATEKLTKLMTAPDAGHRSFYAAGSLLHVLCQDPTRFGDAADLLRRIAGLSQDPWVRKVAALATDLRWKRDQPQEMRALAHARLAQMGDPFGLGLWDRGRRDRAWQLVNRVLPRIFELDDITELGDPGEHADDDPREHAGGSLRGESGKGPSAKPEELDLLDFLGEAPYFVPDDVRSG
ncbi:MAG: HEAT repeat domain-containing protein [Planctomycetota bacterium]